MKNIGQWTTFGLIMGMIISCVAKAGWIVGHFYSDPSQAAAHPIIHPLAKIAVIACPIALIGGIGIFGLSIRYELSRRKRPPMVRTPVPQGLGGFRLDNPYKPRKEVEGKKEDKQPEQNIGP